MEFPCKMYKEVHSTLNSKQASVIYLGLIIASEPDVAFAVGKLVKVCNTQQSV